MVISMSPFVPREAYSSLLRTTQFQAAALPHSRSTYFESLKHMDRRPSHIIQQAAAGAYRDETRAMDEELQLVELNSSLETLAAIFPNIQLEVFREMLSSYSGDSRLPIVTEQLLKQKEQFVKGRWRTPSRDDQSASAGGVGVEAIVTSGDRFRRESYKRATKKALYLEFKGLSRSTIDAVLAEKNYCYTLSRPTLQNIAARTWRSNVSAFFSRWRKTGRDVPEGHFMLVWAQKPDRKATSEPTLKCTGDVELDRELHLTVLVPLIEETKKKRNAEDWLLALRIHEKEAQDAGLLYECGCCFSETTYEQLSACTRDGHMVCFRCLRNAVNEAMFGQSWDQNMDHELGQLRCLAPMTGQGCVGCVPESVVRRALCQEKGGREIWSKLEARLAEDNLLKAQVPLIRCPFCPYAEYDELYLPPSTAQYGLNTSEPFKTSVLLVLLLGLAPFIFIYTLICRWLSFLQLRKPSSLYSTSLARLTRSRHLSRRFRCRSPTCGTASCLSCSKAWHDPHICHESATLSLRKAVEAARTAALKRTCPRCGLGFIKDSGCNKLTCICGYVMCYICRQGLGPGDGNAGYGHFCQHFRPAGGKCAACEKCDLYVGEDEDGAVSRAGQLAEQEWRGREGMVGVDGIGGGQHEMGLGRLWKDEWTLQDVVDWYVARLLTC